MECSFDFFIEAASGVARTSNGIVMVRMDIDGVLQESGLPGQCPFHLWKMTCRSVGRRANFHLPDSSRTGRIPVSVRARTISPEYSRKRMG